MDAVEKQIAALPTAARLGAYGALVALGAAVGEREWAARCRRTSGDGGEGGA